MRHRPEDVVEDEVADLVAERLPGILVIAEVLARVDTARCRLIRGLREALEAPHDAPCRARAAAGRVSGEYAPARPTGPRGREPQHQPTTVGGEPWDSTGRSYSSSGRSHS